MPFKKRISDFIFSAFIGGAYCYSLASYIFSSTLLELPQSQVILLSAASAVLFYIAFFNRYASIIFWTLASLCAASIYFAIKKGSLGGSWIISLKAKLEGLALFFLGAGSHKPEYSLIFGVLLCLALGLFTMLNLRVRFGFYILTLFAAEVIAVPIYMGWTESGSYIFLTSFCLIAMLVKKLNLFTYPGKYGGESRNSVFALLALPLCAVAFAAAFLLPKPDININAEYAREGISAVADGVTKALSPQKTHTLHQEAA